MALSSGIFKVAKQVFSLPSPSTFCLISLSTRGFSSTSEPLTLVEQKDHIRVITLNNPKKRNALSLEMLDRLKESIEDDVGNPELRVIILRSSGPVFSAGHDLKELTSREGQEHHINVFQRCTEVMSLVQDIEVPVIAEVRGLATAAGCQLVASCDVAIACENAKFATPGVSVGLFCHTPAVAVARAIPRKVAMEMLLTGQPISAHDALLHGLVSRVVPEADLHEEVMRIAHRICETSRPVTAFGKSTFYKQIQLTRDQAYRLTEKAMVDNLSLRDGQEGIEAFIGKRPPHWLHTDDKAH